MAIRDMEILGFTFKKENVPGPTGNRFGGRTYYTLRNPKHRVTPDDVLAMRAAHQKHRDGSVKRRKRAKKAEPSSPELLGTLGRLLPNGDADKPRRGRKPARMPAPPLPEMGASLTVAMLAVDPVTGLARIGLRNGEHSYEVTIDSWSTSAR